MKEWAPEIPWFHTAAQKSMARLRRSPSLPAQSHTSRCALYLFFSCSVSMFSSGMSMTLESLTSSSSSLDRVMFSLGTRSVASMGLLGILSSRSRSSWKPATIGFPPGASPSLQSRRWLDTAPWRHGRTDMPPLESTVPLAMLLEPISGLPLPCPGLSRAALLLSSCCMPPAHSPVHGGPAPCGLQGWHKPSTKTRHRRMCHTVAFTTQG